MPKSALRFACPSNSVRQRLAQRSESSIDVAASSRVAGCAVHSSNTITMSESSARCTCIEISGVSSIRSPLTGEANVTPSSRTLRIAPRLHTWKPPESVRSGFGQPMKRCKPPCAAMTSMPGRSHRWNVLPRTICAPSSSSSRGAIALTVPYVPTGMNTGVSTSPCASESRPRRARPDVASSLNSIAAIVAAPRGQPSRARSSSIASP